MATASSNVQVKVEYKGTDNASKASKRATEGVKRFGRSAKQATKDAQGFGKAFEESGDRVSDTSGKASTALSSLGDFAGASEGAFRQASEAAGLLDDVMTVLPGPLGIAAGAIAGLTTVLVLNQQEAERSAAKIRQNFGGDLAAEIKQVRREFEFNADAAVDLGKALEATGLTAADVKDDLARVVREADEIGEDGSAAVSSFARSLLSASKPAEILIRKLQRLNQEADKRTFAKLADDRQEGEAADKAAGDRLDELTKKLRSQQKALRDLRAGRTGETAQIKEQTGLMQRLGNFITNNVNDQQRRVAAIRQDEQAQVDLAYRIGQTTDKIAEFNRLRNNALESSAEAQRQAEQEAKAEANLEFEQSKAFNAEVARIKRLEEQRKAAAAAARARRAREQKQRAIESSERKREIEQQRKLNDAKRAAAEADRARAQELAKQERARAEREAAQKAALAEEKRRFDQAVSSTMALQQQVGALDTSVSNALAALPALGAAAATALQDAADSTVKATALAGQAADGFVESERQRVNEQIKAEEQAALATATSQEQRTAIQERFEAKRTKNLEDTEKRKAAIMALVSAAQAALLFAQGQLPQAASAAVAAASFAAIAGGAVKRVGGGAATAGGGATTGAGAATATTTADAAPSTQGNVVVNFGSGFVIGTQQQIGQAVAGSLRSLRTTGLVTAGGV